MVNTFLLENRMNSDKERKVLCVLRAYRIFCVKLSNNLWCNFYENGEKFDKNVDVSSLSTPLSERYKRNAAYQVAGILKSYMSNAQNRFKEIVRGYKFDKETQKHLFQINSRQAWFSKEHELFSKEELFIANRIFKQVLKWHRKPDFHHQNMLLNSNVAKIIPAEKSLASEFDYWVKFSTLTAGKPIMLPLKGNVWFDSKEGKLCDALQINYDSKRGLTTAVMKEILPEKIEFRSDAIALDIGLRTLFALDNGELYGRNFIEKLKHYDKIISELAANRQRQGFKTRSRRYDLLVLRFRDWLKNEVNRTLNRIFQKHKPSEIIVENLNFSHPDLSKRLNRLLRNFGKSVIEAKLKNFEERYGVTITKINPAYTSQTCAACGYVSKNNRKTQEKFECKCCNKRVHADVNGSRNNRHRSSMLGVTIYTHKTEVLRKLVMQFVARQKIRLSSWADGLLSENPYFAQVQLI